MLTKQGFFNAIDTQNLNLIAGANSELFLKVDILASKFLNGTNETKADVPVPGPEAGGLWRLPGNTTLRIAIPTAGPTHSFRSNGFGAVRALAVDAQGSPSPHDFFGFVAQGDPSDVAAVTSSASQGTLFRIPLIDFNGPGTQTVSLVVTPLANADLIIKDRVSNALIFPQASINQHHSVMVSHPSNTATQIEVQLSGGAGIVSAIVQRRNQFRVYPLKIA